MTDHFTADNTEAWVSYLGATRDEFDALQGLVSSYVDKLGDSGVPLVIVDQSEPTRKEMHELGIDDGPVMLPVHERQMVELDPPDVTTEEIRDVLATLASHPLVRVHATSERLFHSQCINQILNRWCESKFVLLFDSDSELRRPGMLRDLAEDYPLAEWDTITAAGRMVDSVDSTRPTGVGRTLRQWLGLEAPRTEFAPRWRLPRLHPYALMLHRDLVTALGLDFRLLFLDSLERGWRDDPLRTGRILGDTGASLVLQTAYHGFRVGNFPMHDYVDHGGRASHRPAAGRRLRSIGWW